MNQNKMFNKITIYKWKIIIHMIIINKYNNKIL